MKWRSAAISAVMDNFLILRCQILSDGAVETSGASMAALCPMSMARKNAAYYLQAVLNR
jgi:hypothetical protein